MVKAAVGQICSTRNVSHNLQQCLQLVRKAASAGAKALFLPEASDYIASNGAETVALAEPTSSSAFVTGLRSAARQHSLAVNVGVHEPAAGGEKVHNTLLWIDERGEITQQYRKLHLFDVEIEGGPVLRESRSVEKGTEIIPPFDTSLGKVGLLICFDLRFPEPSLRLRRQGATLLTYPSAFTVPTGRAHWTTLLRARAIETQTYVVAAAQVGAHNDKRRSYGHAMAVDPWGEVLAELGEEPGEMAIVEIGREGEGGVLDRVRREMPLQRRTDVYPEI